MQKESRQICKLDQREFQYFLIPRWCRRITVNGNPRFVSTSQVVSQPVSFAAVALFATRGALVSDILATTVLASDPTIVLPV